ncbi:MAG: M12 family metallopeptidase [Gammaproteobacteria bacterium]|nr:M12 family metallopeptidase [Gammaproteobacteria bacterium]
MKFKVFFALTILFNLSSSDLGAAVLLKANMWSKNMTLNVVFIDGSDQQKQWVKTYAPLWLEDSSLSFSFYDDFESAPKATHIRISFTGNTASVAGDHKDYFSKDPTLLLNRLNETDLPHRYIKQAVLHEFGHALGFEHEYRSPNWPHGNQIIDKQIKRCLSLMNMDMDSQHCHKINQPLSRQSAFVTAYDKFSIMNYTHNVELNDNQSKTVTAKTTLSFLDKLAIRNWYGN